MKRNSHICVFPKSSGELSSIGARDILELDEINTNKKLIGTNKDTYNYSYTNIQSIEVREDDIKIGHGRRAAVISFNDIVHAEIFCEKPLDVNLMSEKNDFMLLVVARYDCPLCDNYTGYIDSLIVHTNEIHDKEYDIKKLKEGSKHLSYIYFMPKGNKFAKGGLNNHVELKYDPNITKDDFEMIFEKVKQEAENLDPDINILNNWVEKSGELRIEGLEKDSSITQGTISARTESEGVSRGVQVGPFTKEKSKSQGSIEGKINSVTTDNTFSSDIKFIQIDDDGIYVESDPVIDISYSDIDRVAKRNNGIYAEIGQQTYSIMGYGHFGTSSLEEYDLRHVISTIRKRIEDSNGKSSKKERSDQSDQTPAERMRDLKQLCDDGIISEDEFESKKEELLDEF